MKHHVHRRLRSSPHAHATSSSRTGEGRGNRRKWSPIKVRRVNSRKKVVWISRGRWCDMTVSPLRRPVEASWRTRCTRPSGSQERADLYAKEVLGKTQKRSSYACIVRRAAACFWCREVWSSLTYSEGVLRMANLARCFALLTPTSVWPSQDHISMRERLS